MAVLGDISVYVADRPPPGGSGRGPPYYGDAELEGTTVYVGGAERTVGGWASHEIARRRAKWGAHPDGGDAGPSSRYQGRTYVSGGDVLESVFAPPRGVAGGGGGALGDPLGAAAERLAAALEALEGALAGRGASSLWSRLGLPPDAPLTVPALTPSGVRGAQPETDVYELHRLAEEVALLATTVRGGPSEPAPPPPAGLPPLPRPAVPVGDGAGIVRLEEGAAPHAAAVEEYRGRVAACFDEAAVALEEALSGQPSIPGA